MEKRDGNSDAAPPVETVQRMDADRELESTLASDEAIEERIRELSLRTAGTSRAGTARVSTAASHSSEGEGGGRKGGGEGDGGGLLGETGGSLGDVSGMGDSMDASQLGFEETRLQEAGQCLLRF